MIFTIDVDRLTLDTGRDVDHIAKPPLPVLVSLTPVAAGRPVVEAFSGQSAAV